MKQAMILFKIGLKQIVKDGMLLVLLPTPFLVGIIFRFVIPNVNNILENERLFSLVPWYGIIDGLLICLTPMLVSTVVAFLLLDERDEGITAFYRISPIVGYAYLGARIGIPMIWAFMITILSISIFAISNLSIFTIITTSIISLLTGVSLSMMIVSLAGNRVEGLAISKLTGISILALVLVWFIQAPYYYVLAALPPFWIGKIIFDGLSIYSFVFGLISCILWIIFFTKKFSHQIS